jgi:CHASE2 domain-containing sensor protein
MDNSQLIILTVFFALCVVGFFRTKTEGYGQYTSSILILIVVLYIGALAFMTGKVDWQGLSPLLLAIVGFAGGLVAERAKKSKPDPDKGKTGNKVS